MQIRTKLYKGKVELVFESFRHTYTITDKENNIFGEKMPSATTALSIIAKPALIYWASNMCADSIKDQLEPGKKYDELEINAIIESGRKAHTVKKKKAGAIGSFVHRWVEDYINGQNPQQPVNEQLATAVAKFMGWVKEHKVKFLLAEQQVYDRKYGFTGTLDFICEINGKMYIGDLKTSNGIYYNQMGMQLAAYKMAREREYPNEKYNGCLLVRIGKKEGEFETWQFEDDSVFRAGFIYALKLYEKEQKIKQLEKSGEFRKTR